MQFNTSRFNHSHSGRQSLPFCSPFLKSKDMSDIFLDKKTVNRKLQKLMLDVKDLDSKMFLSKMISYLDEQAKQNNFTEGFQMKPNQEFDQKRIQDLLFESQTQKQVQITETETRVSDHDRIQNLSLCPMLISLDLHPVQIQQKAQEKEMFQTATSEGFFPNRKPSIHISNPIIEESFSEGSTIQCECGLFQALLLMVSRFIKEEIVKNRQQSGDDCLQIDDQFVEEITRQVIAKFYERENQYKTEVQKLRFQLQKTKELLKVKQQLLMKDGMIAKESLAIKQMLKLKQSQQQQAVEQMTKMNNQLKIADKQLSDCTKKLANEKMNFEQLQISFSELQEQYLKINQQKQELETKLSTALKQIERHSSDKQLYEETKQHEVDSLSFQIQLKNTEIRNMKTIIQSLQKRTSLYGQQIEIQEQKNQNDNENSVDEAELSVQSQEQ